MLVWRQELEYDAVLLSPPSKFVAPNLEAQVGCLAEVLKYCPNTPAFYYHYPIVYRDDFDLVELYELAKASCPTLCGCKLSGCVSLWRSQGIGVLGRPGVFGAVCCSRMTDSRCGYRQDTRGGRDPAGELQTRGILRDNDW